MGQYIIEPVVEPVELELRYKNVEYITDGDKLIQGDITNLDFNRVIQGDNLVYLTEYKRLGRGAGVIVFDPPRLSYLGDSLGSQLGYLKKRIELSWDILDDGGYLLVMLDILDSHYVRVLLEDTLTGVYTTKINVIRKLEGYDEVLLIQKGEEVTEVIDQEVVFVSDGELYDVRPIFQQQGAPFIPQRMTRSIAQYYRDYQPNIWEEVTKYPMYYLEPTILPDLVVDKLEEGCIKAYINGNGSRYIYKRDGVVYKLKDEPKVREDLKLDLMYTELFNNEQYDYVEGKKPLSLVKKILQYTASKSYLVLDIFAGSGTTGQAVMELNTADKGNRRFILVEKDDITHIIYPRLKQAEANKTSGNCVFQRLELF